jgi:FMN phosphatase YigB (HAD superfamily)
VIIGELSFRRALNEIGSTLGVTVAHERVTEACDARVRANAEVFGRIRPDILALTRDLRSAGLVLGVISNCFAEDVATWSRSELAPQFDCHVWSFSTGRAKPDPLIYREATERLGVPPGETLFVADGGDDELGGAARAGLQVAQVIWFVSRPLTLGIPHLRAPADVRRVVEEHPTAVDTLTTNTVVGMVTDQS